MTITITFLILPVHCMNTSCMSCVYDMSRTHYFTLVVWRAGTRYADVRLVSAEFQVVVRRLILRNSKGNDQISGRFLGAEISV